jgi:hypothetical protein
LPPFALLIAVRAALPIAGRRVAVCSFCNLTRRVQFASDGPDRLRWGIASSAVLHRDGAFDPGV